MASPNYFQPGFNYGTSTLFPNGFGNTSAGQRFWDNNAQGAFTRWLSEKGIPQHSKFGTWAQTQFNDTRNSYTAALGNNPELTYYGQPDSFLNTLNLRNTWLNKPFQERGAMPNLFATRARRLPRGQ